MPRLKNAKHELFCQKIATAVPQSETYATISGASKSVQYNASWLRANEAVAGRIEELSAVQQAKQERETAGKGLGKEDVIRLLEHEAENCPTVTARIRAQELLGKIFGIEGFTTTNVRHLRSPFEISRATCTDRAGAHARLCASASQKPRRSRSNPAK